MSPATAPYIKKEGYFQVSLQARRELLYQVQNEKSVPQLSHTFTLNNDYITKSQFSINSHCGGVYSLNNIQFD